MGPRVDMQTCIHSHMRTCVHAFVRVCARMCARACDLRACMRICVHTYMRTCIPAYMRTCVHACVRRCMPSSRCTTTHTISTWSMMDKTEDIERIGASLLSHDGSKRPHNISEHSISCCLGHPGRRGDPSASDSTTSPSSRPWYGAGNA